MASNTCTVLKRRCGRTNRRRRGIKDHSPNIRVNPEQIVFCKWMKTMGFSFKNCSMVPKVFRGTGRGLMTKISIHSGDTIISIPVDLLVNPEVVLQTDIGHHIERFITDKISEATLSVTSQLILSIFLIWERHKNTDSKWFPYITILPKDFTTPGYLKDELLTLLPRRLFQKVQNHMKKLETSYRDLLNYCESSWEEMYNIVDFRTFCWAWYCVNSRGVYYKGRNNNCVLTEGNEIALAPYLDYFNHSVIAQVEAGYNSKTQCYEIKTFDKYKKYDQIFISYGPHDNHHLFIEYGFVQEDNPHDVFEFEFDRILESFKKNVDYLDKKLDILRSNDLVHSKLCCTIEGLSWNLLVVLRILSMNWDELSSWNKVFQGNIISERNEKIVKSVAKEMVMESFAETKNLLQKFRVTFNNATYEEKMVYQLLVIDSNILRNTLNFM